jgi:hypothetical protein
MNKKIQRSSSSPLDGQEEEFSSMCVLYDGFMLDEVPQIKPSECSTKSSRSQQPPAEGVKSLRDEEVGEEKYDLHFGTAVIDSHGKGHRDPTVKALIFGAPFHLVSIEKLSDRAATPTFVDCSSGSSSWVDKSS